MFAFVIPHDFPFLFLFTIFVSSLGVCCSQLFLFAAAGEGKGTKEAGAESPASIHCEDERKGSQLCPPLLHCEMEGTARHSKDASSFQSP